MPPRIPLRIPRHPLPRLGLPPAARRDFHSSRPAASPLATFLDTTTSLLTSTHAATGLSWSTLIPLTALTLRLLTTTPLTLYSRRTARKVLALQPVIAAHTHIISRRLRTTTSEPAVWQRETRKAAWKKRAEVYRRWGCQRWKSWLSLGQVPVWVAASLTMRELAKGGAAAGEGEGATVAEEVGKVGATVSDMAEQVAGLAVDGGAAVTETAQRIVAGIHTEGLPFCLDLAATDPTWTLPVVFSLALLANVRIQAWAAPARGKWQKRIVRILTVVALAAAPVSATMPAGVVLYWATSAVWSAGFNGVLQWVSPIERGVLGEVVGKDEEMEKGWREKGEREREEEEVRRAEKAEKR
ncbi:60Kd inner membrane protein-domain-containing protein [Geopyxis carbonaria]|nr:60Kd inner membrane protein-domain-containing protein [Geopyxis carbonaria]